MTIIRSISPDEGTINVALGEETNFYGTTFVECQYYWQKDQVTMDSGTTPTLNDHYIIPIYSITLDDPDSVDIKLILSEIGVSGSGTTLDWTVTSSRPSIPFEGIICNSSWRDGGYTGTAEYGDDQWISIKINRDLLSDEFFGFALYADGDAYGTRLYSDTDIGNIDNTTFFFNASEITDLSTNTYDGRIGVWKDSFSGPNAIAVFSFELEFINSDGNRYVDKDFEYASDLNSGLSFNDAWKTTDFGMGNTPEGGHLYIAYGDYSDVEDNNNQVFPLNGGVSVTICNTDGTQTVGSRVIIPVIRS